MVLAGAVTVKVKAEVAPWLGFALSLTCTVKLGEPTVVGVPLNNPVDEFNVIPAGSEPLAIVQL